MKTKITLLITLMLTLWASPVFAQENTNYGINFSYRIDNLQWSHAGNISGQNPNILSELTWRNLKIYQFDGFFKTNLKNDYFFYGNLKYGVITGGQNQDSDYYGDNRTNEYSRSNNGVDGDVLDLTEALGFYLIQKPTLIIASSIGYSYNQQNLVTINGYQTIPNTGPFSGLHSTYNTKWFGPWIGIDFEKKLTSKLRLYNAIEYHWMDYEAKADWNLRSDFQHPVSFRHTASGDGYTIITGIDYLYKNYTKIQFKIHYSNWQADPGLNEQYYLNGGTVLTRLNEITWTSITLSFGVKRCY